MFHLSLGKVIVKYKKNVDSLVQSFKRMGLDVHVIDKETRLNVGHEALAYLEFIIEHYEYLPTHIVFVHDEEYSWHHEGSLVDRIGDHVGTYVELETLNRHFFRPAIYTTGNPKEIEHNSKYFQGVKEIFDTCLRDEMRSLSLDDYGDFIRGIGCCAQFIVHKDVIHHRSLGAYTCLRDWIIRTAKDAKDKYPAEVLEHSWNLMWERVHCEDDQGIMPRACVSSTNETRRMIDL
jgi:hypothetical protein